MAPELVHNYSFPRKTCRIETIEYACGDRFDEQALAALPPCEAARPGFVDPESESDTAVAAISRRVFRLIEEPVGETA